jgi:uncharacterized membrane protein
MARHWTLVVAALLCVAAPAFPDGLSWNVQLLPDEPDWLSTSAGGVNANADAVGRYTTTAWTRPHAVLWERGSGTYTDIATLFGGLPSGYQFSFANAINDNGLIGGGLFTSRTNLSFTRRAAAIWDRNTGQTHVVHPSVPGFDSSGISELNNAGVAVGELFNWNSFNALAYV